MPAEEEEEKKKCVGIHRSIYELWKPIIKNASRLW